MPAGNIALNKVVEGEEQGIGSLTDQPRIIFLDSGYSFLPFLIMEGEQVFVGSLSQRSKASSCQRAPLVASSILSGQMLPCKLVFPAEGTRDSRTHRDLIMFFIGVIFATEIKCFTDVLVPTLAQLIGAWQQKAT